MKVDVDLKTLSMDELVSLAKREAYKQVEKELSEKDALQKSRASLSDPMV